MGQLQPGTETEILRDSWGVPHIFGRTDADVAYGLAYAHAKDDFGPLPVFVQRELKPVWFDEADIRANKFRSGLSARGRRREVGGYTLIATKVC